MKSSKRDWLKRNEAGDAGLGWSYSSGLEKDAAPLAGPGADWTGLHFNIRANG